MESYYIQEGETLKIIPRYIGSEAEGVKIQNN